jgi:hypothetical protein
MWCVQKGQPQQHSEPFSNDTAKCGVHAPDGAKRTQLTVLAWPLLLLDTNFTLGLPSSSWLTCTGLDAL